MPKFKDTVVTNAGTEMLGNSLENVSMAFTKAITTTDDLSNMTNEQIEVLTKFNNVVQTADVAVTRDEASQQITVATTIPNTNVNEEYKCTAIGWQVTDSNGNQAIYGITPFTNAELISVPNGAVGDVSLTATVTFNIDNAANVTIVANSDGMATRADVIQASSQAKNDDQKILNQANAYTDSGINSLSTQADHNSTAALSYTQSSVSVAQSNAESYASSAADNAAEQSVKDNHNGYVVVNGNTIKPVSFDGNGDIHAHDFYINTDKVNMWGSAVALLANTALQNSGNQKINGSLTSTQSFIAPNVVVNGRQAQTAGIYQIYSGSSINLMQPDSYTDSQTYMGTNLFIPANVNIINGPANLDMGGGLFFTMKRIVGGDGRSANNPTVIYFTTANGANQYKALYNGSWSAWIKTTSYTGDDIYTHDIHIQTNDTNIWASGIAKQANNSVQLSGDQDIYGKKNFAQLLLNNNQVVATDGNGDVHAHDFYFQTSVGEDWLSHVSNVAKNSVQLDGDQTVVGRKDFTDLHFNGNTVAAVDGNNDLHLHDIHFQNDVADIWASGIASKAINSVQLNGDQTINDHKTFTGAVSLNGPIDAHGNALFVDNVDQQFGGKKDFKNLQSNGLPVYGTYDSGWVQLGAVNGFGSSYIKVRNGIAFLAGYMTVGQDVNGFIVANEIPNGWGPGDDGQDIYFDQFTTDGNRVKFRIRKNSIQVGYAKNGDSIGLKGINWLVE